MSARNTAAIASVAPQVTVTFRSESTSMSYQRRYFAAIAMRSEGVPQVIAYWLMLAWMAMHAASFRGCGMGKSGIPWARLSAPCSLAMRVISRITDSVNVLVRRAVGMIEVALAARS